MPYDADMLPSVNAILSGPNWPGRVRVVRVDPRGASRVLIEAVTLDEQARLISRVFRVDELASLQIEASDHLPSLDGDPLGFKLAAEATRIRLAYTYDPQFAVSVAHIDPLPHQLEAVYHHMLRQPRIRFLLADDPGAGKTIMAGLLLKELKLRGAVTRTLIVAPANLAPQWQRELGEKFDEAFDLVDRAALAARESRAWEISDQCVVSMDFAWRADVLESLARAQRWDLVIVDEAHKMAAYQRGSKLERTRRYRLGELLTEHSEHLLLLTATPHKGDPDNFRLLLQLVDPDLFADTDILARAVQRQENPIFLRRLKEDMVDFDGRPLFPPRHVKTLGVELTEPEQALYEEVTRYVGETFNRALAEQNRNVTFALIVLQRRLASSVRAIRRSLENRRDRLASLCDLVRADPELLAAAANGAVSPRQADGDEWEDLPEQERWQAEEQALRFTVARNLEELEAEVAILDRLARQALAVEQNGPERKLDELRRVMEQGGLLRPAGAAPVDGPEKLLIFTEAKDTLDYLCENLAAWGLSVISIDGTMAPPERYRAEQHFRDPNGAQVMVATEAAGEGINLQFCHLMINYDLPWNPTRLEQRMGRVHRYGQRYEVVVTNLVATSTREGMVWQALFHKLERMRAGLGQDRVFDVIDQLLEGVSLEHLLRDALANLLTFEEVRERVLARLGLDQERRLEEATLTGLATRYVDLGRLRADRQQAAEARLVPAYIRDFFVKAMDALAPGRLDRRDDGFYRIPYVPAALRDVPDSLRRLTGLPADSYGAVTFDKADLAHTPGLTFVGPGHPLFEAVMHHVLARFGPDLSRGAVLVDTQSRADGLVWLLAGSVEDGLGRVAGKQLFALFQPLDGDPLRRIFPGRLIDFDPPPDQASSGGSQSPDRARLAQARRLLADPTVVEEWSLDQVLEPYLHELQTRRSRETTIVQDYLRRSFDVLIARSQAKLMDYERRAQRGVDMGLSLQDERRHLDELRRRQAQRLAVSQRAAALALGAPEIIGVALVTPAAPAVVDTAGGPAMRRSDAVEEAAMAHAMAMEQALGWQVEDVHEEDRGYDLVSYSPIGQIRYIEVKGRAGVGDVELSQNEWLKAQQLGGDYWLYVVSNALTAPDLQRIQNPTQRLSGDEVVERVRYRVRQEGWRRVAESRVAWGM
jgi:superfamily II DNA or RNA helicase